MKVEKTGIHLLNFLDPFIVIYFHAYVLRVRSILENQNNRFFPFSKNMISGKYIFQILLKNSQNWWSCKILNRMASEPWNASLQNLKCVFFKTFFKFGMTGMKNGSNNFKFFLERNHFFEDVKLSWDLKDD